MDAPLLEVSGLCKRFSRGGISIAAVDDVDFHVGRGETLALVGPSGSGKSTVARLVLRLLEADAGSIRFAGDDWLALRGRALRRARKNIQMVFQDPLAAFNPRATVARVLADPLRIHHLVLGRERARAIAGLLARVGLSEDLAHRAIHEISGGQRQRVAIARAIATKPALVILDEAVSALDVVVRTEILALLGGLQRQEGIAYLFITHDLSVARALAHRVAVMEAGRIVEIGPTRTVLSAPRSAMAAALLEAEPRLRDFKELP